MLERHAWARREDAPLPTLRSEIWVPVCAGTTAGNLTPRRRRCFAVQLLQEQLVPQPLPLRRLGERFDRIDHDVFVRIEQRLLRPARWHAAHIAEELLALGREHEVGE